MESSSKIIENYKVLTTEYLPNKLLHRTGQRKEIARCIEPLLTDQGHTRNMLIHGPPGTGKTHMAQHVVQELKEKMFLQDMYVNCFQQKNRFQILYELVDKKLSLPRKGTSTAELKDELDKKIREKPSLIVIDEVDQISDGEILYDLSRYLEAPLIMTANNPNCFAYFDDRIQSRMTNVKKIKFRPYSNSEMTDILDRRISKGLNPAAIPDPIRQEIVENSSGDARKAITTLKHAAQDAQSRGRNQITKEIVKEALTDADQEQKQKSSDRLNQHQKKLKEILQEEHKLGMTELHQKYQEQTEQPKSKRTIRRYLNKMQNYNLIKSTGKKNGKKYSAV